MAAGDAKAGGFALIGLRRYREHVQSPARFALESLVCYAVCYRTVCN